MIEKLELRICSYANGVFAYSREVAARTIGAHPRYAVFKEYADVEHYRHGLRPQRFCRQRRQ